MSEKHVKNHQILLLFALIVLLFVFSLSVQNIVCFNTMMDVYSSSGGELHTILQQSSQISVIDYERLLGDSSTRKKLVESTVIGVNDYYAIYLWKDKMINLFNISQSPQTLEEFVQIIKNSNRTINLAVTSALKPAGITKVNLFGFQSVSQQVQLWDLTSTSDCARSDNMIVNDGFIGTASSISIPVKAHKMVLPWNKQELEFKNFYSIRYIPRSLVVSSLKSNTVDQQIDQYLSNIVENNMRYLNTTAQCGTSQVTSRDAAWSRYGFSFVNFTVQDIQAVEQIFGLTITYDQSYANSVIGKYRSYLYFNESMNSVMSHLSDSSCMACPYALCYLFIEQDYASYIGVGINLFYFIMLFSLGLFRSYSLKRRLFLPYLPFFGIVRNFSNTQMLSVTCSSISRPLALFASVVIIAIYCFTIIRYVYMRNMYQLLSKSNAKLTTQFHKRILSIPFSLFMSCVFILMFSLILVLPPTVAFEIYTDNFIINGVGAAILFLSIIASISFLGIDLLLNRNNIKRFGLMKYLFFDDPMYLRIDIFFQAMILIFIILYIVVGFFDAVFPAIMDVCISISVILICGGNAMIIELSKKIIYKDRNKNRDEEESQLEILLEKNKEFYTLMSEYATKEFSFENIAFYDAIFEYKKSRKSISLDDLKRIEKEFLHSYSKYEVNLPSQVRKDFTNLVQDLSSPEPSQQQQQEEYTNKIKIRKEQLVESMFLELCKNLTDTFQRLKQTQQYSKWLEVYQLQQENSLNV